MNDTNGGKHLCIDAVARPDGLLFLEVAGFLDASNFNRLEKALDKAFDEGKTRIIMDVGRLSYINSAGVGVILAAISRARSTGGDIVLVRPTDNVAIVFDLIGMSKFSNIVETMDEAEEIFRKPSV